MAQKPDLEARLRRAAEGYDTEVPPRPGLEGRILARATATEPVAPRRVPLMRELAVAAGLLLIAGAVGVGVIQLRAIHQATGHQTSTTLPERLSYTPGKVVPPGLIDLGSARSGATFRMFTPLRGWAVGPFGKGGVGPSQATLVTADGGSHWRNVTPPGFAPAMDRLNYFFDVTHAWVALTPAQFNNAPGTATLAVFRTADGGVSWQRGTLQFSDGTPTELDFIDAIHGWMVLQNNRGIAIYGTVDGGATWTFSSQQILPQGPGVAPATGSLPLGAPSPDDTNPQPDCSVEPSIGIAFHDRSQGWAAGTCSGPEAKAYLYASHDWGKTWEAQSIPPLPAAATCPCSVTTTAPEFTSVSNGTFTASVSSVETACQTVGTSRGCTSTAIPVHMYIYMTADGGASWAIHQLPGAAGGTPTFGDTHTGWHWATVLKPAPNPHYETVFDKLYITHDGGVTWTPLTTTANFQGGDMQFVNTTTGWMLNGVGLGTQLFLRTTDGGRTWQPISTVLDR